MNEITKNYVQINFASWLISKKNDEDSHLGGYFPTPYGILRLYWQRQMWAWEYLELESDRYYREYGAKQMYKIEDEK